MGARVSTHSEPRVDLAPAEAGVRVKAFWMMYSNCLEAAVHKCSSMLDGKDCVR